MIVVVVFCSARFLRPCTTVRSVEYILTYCRAFFFVLCAAGLVVAVVLLLFQRFVLGDLDEGPGVAALSVRLDCTFCPGARDTLEPADTLFAVTPGVMIVWGFGWHLRRLIYTALQMLKIDDFVLNESTSLKIACKTHRYR